MPALDLPSRPDVDRVRADREHQPFRLYLRRGLDGRAAPRWLLAAIDLLGPDRVMLGSHLPIRRPSHGFAHLCRTYRDLLAGFSAAEQDLMFRRLAVAWFGVGS